MITLLDKFTQEEIIEVLYPDAVKKEDLFFIEPYLDWQDQAYIKEFAQKTFLKLMKETRLNYYKDYKTAFTFYATLREELEDNLYDFFFNNYDLSEYQSSEDKMIDHFDLTLQEWRTWLNSDEYFELEESVALDFCEIEKIFFNTQINFAVVLANSENFNSEFSEDGSDIIDYGELEENSQIQQFLEKQGLNPTELFTANDKPFANLITSIENSYDNCALVFPMAATLNELCDLMCKTSTLTVPENVQFLGLHCYNQGAGSVGLDETLVQPIKSITYQPGEWIILPESTYGYSLEDTYGFWDEDYEQPFTFTDIVKKSTTTD